nr:MULTISPECIES: hypothetical protein [unclassified Roseobacter]
MVYDEKRDERFFKEVVVIKAAKPDNSALIKGKSQTAAFSHSFNV